MAGIPVDVAKVMQRENLAAMRREYTRMRDIAQKRIGRLRGSEFSGSVTANIQYDTGKRDKEGNAIMAPGFPKLKNISENNFAKAFSELSKFVEAKRSSITGQKEIRQKTIETWNKQGIPLNKQNYDRTIAILEEMRKRKIVYGSDTARELADTTLALNSTQFNHVLDNLETYLSHVDDVADAMDEMRDPQTGYTLIDMNELDEKIGW